MCEKIKIVISPRADCRACHGKGTVRGCSVPVPFGSGSCSLPDEFCDCVIEQVPDNGDEYEITLADVGDEKWKAGNCGGSVVSDMPNHHDTEDNIKFYGGYLVAESIGSERHKRLIIASPEMLRVLEKALPIITAEALRRDDALPDEREGHERVYWKEMRELAGAITNILYFARYGVMPEPPAPDYPETDEDCPENVCPHGVLATNCTECIHAMADDYDCAADDQNYDAARERRSKR